MALATTNELVHQEQLKQQSSKSLLATFFNGSEHLYSFIGPFFLMVNLSLFSIKEMPFFIFFSLTSFLVWSFSYKLEKKALLFASISYLFLVAFSFSELLLIEKFWLVGSAVSFLLSHFIIIQSIQHSSSVFLDMKQELLQGKQQVLLIEKNSQEAESSLVKELEILLQEIEKLKEQAKQRVIEKNQLQNLYELSRQEVLFLLGQKESLLLDLKKAQGQIQQSSAALHQLRQSQKETQTSNVLDQSMNSNSERQLQVNQKQNEAHLYQNNESQTELLRETTCNKDMRHLTLLYNQLREQFQQKHQVLSDTRAELFQAEGKIHHLNVLEKISLEESLWQEFKSFYHDFKNLIEINIQLEKEIATLEELIQSINYTQTTSVRL